MQAYGGEAYKNSVNHIASRDSAVGAAVAVLGGGVRVWFGVAGRLDGGGGEGRGRGQLFSLCATVVAAALFVQGEDGLRCHVEPSQCLWVERSQANRFVRPAHI